jgi:hypothetical protein
MDARGDRSEHFHPVDMTQAWPCLLIRESVAQVFAQILIALGLIGTSIAQIIACASDVYYINTSLDKR